MPKPVFILLAHSAAVDEASKQLSIFEVVEKIAIMPIPTLKPNELAIFVWKPFVLVATWMREDEDRGQTFDFEVRMNLFDEEPVAGGSGSFRFDEEDGRPFYRLMAKFEQPFPVKKTGILRFENRIRKVGGDVWFSQDYAVIVESATGKPPS